MANYDSLPSDMWSAARFIWEHTADISYAELIEKLREIYGDDAPKSKSTINARKKKEGWIKKRILKKGLPNTERQTEQPNDNENKNNKESDNHAVSVYRTASERIEEMTENLVLDSQAKAAIIRKHRRRIAQLGELQDSTMGTLNLLHGKNLETDGEEIQRIIIVAETSSRTLAQLSATQKIVFEQEMAVCGITVDDFKESEQDRRMKGIEQLAGIAERERLERQKGLAGLQDRLRRFRELEVDELAASVGLADGGSDYDDDEIEDADYSEIDE